MNPVFYWNSVLLEASRRDYTAGYQPVGGPHQVGPTATSRAMAIVHLAIHDAVAVAANKPGAAWLSKRGIDLPITQPPASLADAVSGAAMRSLMALYGEFAGFLTESLTNAQGSEFDSESYAAGEAIAEAILAVRANDGWQNGDPITAINSCGPHEADPLHPSQIHLHDYWGSVDHFCLSKNTPLEVFPGGADADDCFADPDFQADSELIFSLGKFDSEVRTPDQTQIGVFWGYDGANGIGVPPRLYNQIARQLAARIASDVERCAELFAVINVAMADAGIDAWYHKYRYNLWRPVVPFRRATDWEPLGAPQTNSVDPVPLTPPFPAYPSGHATFGAALFQSLRLLLNPDSPPLSVEEVLQVEHALASGELSPVQGEEFQFLSDELDGLARDFNRTPDVRNGDRRVQAPRQFLSFAHATYENSISRVYLGVHWKFDGLPPTSDRNVGGVPLGLEIGKAAHALFATAPSLGAHATQVLQEV